MHAMHVCTLIKNRICGRVQAGTVSGEDYNFHFSGRVRDGKLHFRLHMEYEGDDPALAAPRSRRTIDFVCAPRCLAEFEARKTGGGEVVLRY